MPSRPLSSIYFTGSALTDSTRTTSALTIAASVIALTVALGFSACKSTREAPIESPQTPPTELTPRPAVSAPQTTSAVTTTPMLWRVTTPSGKVSHLFGTMHLGIRLDRDVHPLVLATVADATTFIMEADITTANGKELLQRVHLPADARLDRMLSPDTWAQLLALLPEVPRAELVRMQPWFALMLVVQKILPTVEPMDNALRKAAQRTGARVSFLETWQYQLDLLINIIGIRDLTHTITHYDNERVLLLTMAEAYKAGDVSRASALLFDPAHYARNPKLIDVILIRRNKEWLPTLRQAMSTGGAFVAVGLGHLLGTQGILAQLRKLGHTVKRVTPS